MAPALFALDSTSILHDCCPAPLLGNSVALVSLACYTAIHTAPVQVVEPAILTPAVPVPQQQQVCRLCPNGVHSSHAQGRAGPAVAGPLSKSTVPTVLWLLHRLTPAQAVPVCLWCPTSST